MLVFQSLEVDAEAAIDLINYAYFKRVVQKLKKKQDNRVDEEDGTQSKKWACCYNGESVAYIYFPLKP